MKENIVIPNINACLKYLPEAEKIDELPEDQISVVDLSFTEEQLKKLDLIAEASNTTVENVLRSFMIALVKENKDK